MNSYNHYAYGAVCQWLFEAVAGFRPDANDPGFATIIFEPTIIPDLSPVNASHESPRGFITASWTVKGNTAFYEVEVPQGARGVLKLAADYRDVTVDGVAFDGGDLSPGKHSISFKFIPPVRAVKEDFTINARTP
ncbi:Bacterial alpha-L-rhamnosidase [compost metagenome]